jgi:hypothetical protein
MSNVYDYLDEIVGASLSAITFVMDYYQFQFDGPMLNVLTSVTVDSESGRAVTGDDQFRNLVCGQIGKIVRAVTVREGEAIVVTFEDGSEVRFSLKESDYPGPEAVIFYGGSVYGGSGSTAWGVF